MHEPSANVPEFADLHCAYCGKPFSAANPELSALAGELRSHWLQGCMPENARPESEADLELLSLAEVVRHLVAVDEQWCVRARDGRWLCPVTGNLTAIKLAAQCPGEGAEMFKIVAHVSSLEEYKNGAAVPLGSKYIRTRLKFLEDSEWSNITADGRWVSPLTGEATDIVRAAGAPLETIWPDVWAHACLHHDGARRTRNLERERFNALVQAVARRFTHDPEWRKFDDEGRWVCPYEQCAVPGIPRGDDEAGARTAVMNISEHLLYHCRVFPELTRGVVTARLDQFINPDSAGEAARGSSTRLRATAAQNGGDTRTLEEARRKQLKMLPFPPNVPGVDIAVTYLPSEYVGGDFYDFIPLPDGNSLGIVQGDVSGHGLEVWGDMAMAMKTMRIHARQSGTPAEMLVLSNEELVPDLMARTFVSAIYGVLDLRSFKLRIARAGHNPLLLYNPRRKPLQSLFIAPDGMVLGMTAGERFSRKMEELEIQLYSGDLLLFHTDGVTEATNASKEEYGTQRLAEAVQRAGSGRPQRVLEEILQDLERFADGRQFEDDITLTALSIC